MTNTVTQPRHSVAEATRLALQDERFATERCSAHGRDVLSWASGPKHLLHVFEMSQSRPQREYLVMDEFRLSFGEFGKAVRHLAERFLQVGLARGDRVALLMRNRPEWPVVFFATTLSGGIIVPLNGWSDPAQLQATIDDAAPRILIHDRGDADPAAFGVEHVWGLAGLESASAFLPDPGIWDTLEAPPIASPPPAPDDVAAIFYTSGTTGKPKGAMLTHRGIAAVVRNTEFQRARLLLRYPQIAPPIGDGDQKIGLYPVPFFHVTGAISCMVTYTAFGDKLVLMHKWDPHAALDIIERERVTVLGGVPTVPLQILQQAKLEGRDLSSLQGVVYGGAPAPTHLPAAIEARLTASPGTGWGMTEVSGPFLINGGPDYMARPGSCGLPTPVNEVRIVGPDGMVLPLGTAGELQVAGVTVTPGYWRNPSATEAAFDGEWFRTGDLAKVDADGFVTIIDRLKDIIIRGGENIPSVELEDALSAHRDVLECAVIGRSHPLLGEEPVAFVVLAPGTRTTDDIAADMLAKLGRQKAPVAYHVVSQPLPRNAAGKVAKQMLRPLATAADKN